MNVYLLTLFTDETKEKYDPYQAILGTFSTRMDAAMVLERDHSPEKDRIRIETRVVDYHIGANR